MGKKKAPWLALLFLTAAVFSGIASEKWLRLYWAGLPGWLFWTIWIVPSGMFVCTFRVPRGVWKSLFRRVGEIWISLALYPLMFIVIFFFIRILLPRALSFRAAGWWVIGCTVLIFACAVPRALIPRVKKYTLSFPSVERPVRLVLLSDLHLGFFTPASLLPRLQKMVNEQKPEAVLIAGDIFDEEYSALRRPDKAAAILSGLKSDFGTYACEGNHDNYCPSPEAEEFCRRAGIRMLRDKSVDLGVILLTGRLDFRCAQRRSAAQLLESLPCDKPRLVLDHNPRDWKNVLESGADLVLSGHTHGGQTFPGNVLASLVMKGPVYGRHDHAGGTCIVTSGAGIWGLPLRFGVSGEIVVLDLFPE